MTTSSMAADVNYIKFNKLKRLCGQLSSNMTEEKGKMSTHNIRSVIETMQREMIRTKNYSHDVDKTYNDKLPQPDMSSPTLKKEPIIIEDGNVYVHVDMFKDIRRNETDSLLDTSLMKIMHKFTKKHRIILGRPNKTNGIIRNPQVFRTLSLEPHASRIHIIKEGTDADLDIIGLENQQNSVPLYGITYDIWGYIKRSEELGYDIIAEGHTLEHVNDRMNNSSCMEKTYPKDFIDNNTSRKRSVKEADIGNYEFKGLMKKYCMRN